MPSDLDLLIDHYQWEIVRIKKSIEENLELHHYKEIEFDQRALGYAKTELNRLLELKNPLHRNIQKAKEMIGFYERIKQKKGKGEQGSFWIRHYDEKINQEKANLNQLEDIKTKDQMEESQIIDEAVYGLIDGNHSSFKLKLRELDDSSLKVIKVDEVAFELIFRTPVDKLSWLKEYSVLRELDFKMNEDHYGLIKEFKIGHPKNILSLKELISKVVIGLKYPLGIQNKIYLEIH